MRGFLLGAFALVAACGGDGVYIEVRVPAGMAVDQVDLYLATTGCQPDRDGVCDGIVPPSEANATRARVDGEVFFVDDNRPFVSTPDGDGSAWFHLDPTSQFEIKTAIAVGHDLANVGTGVAILRPIDLDVTQHVRLDLEPVASQQVRGQEQPAVEVWGPTGDDYRCVAAEVKNRVVYIVPHSDPDCDQVALTGGEECLPGVFLGQQAVSSDLSEQTCSISEATGLCVLGSKGCDERNPSDATSCVASTDKRYCVPDRLCSACGDVLDGTCFEGLFGAGSRIDCIVEVEADPQGGLGTQSCPDKSVPGAPINDLPCKQAEIATIPDGVQGFASNVTVPIAGSPDGVTLKPILEGNGCKLGLAPLNAEFANTPLQTIRSLVKVDVTPPNANTESFLILPLKVAFVVAKDCLTGTATQCSLTIAPDDHFSRCFP